MLAHFTRTNSVQKRMLISPPDGQDFSATFSVHGSTSSQETAFLVIYINGKYNNNGGMQAIKRAPNSSHALCFLPTPFDLRANILLRTNGEKWQTSKLRTSRKKLQAYEFLRMSGWLHPTLAPQRSPKCMERSRNARNGGR
ncbi:MAG: hypothetical protein WC091_08265 [Sulfuricellaceae bacterium]